MNNATAITTRTMAIRPGQRVIIDSRRPPGRITGTVVTVNGAGSCGVRLDGSHGGAIAEVKVPRIISNFDPISQGQTMRDNYANNATRKELTMAETLTDKDRRVVLTALNFYTDAIGDSGTEGEYSRAIEVWERIERHDRITLRHDEPTERN